MTQPQRCVKSKNDTEARIIHAAVHLFSRQGYNGTSTREIARLAEVNEVTIYRLFNRKKELFWAAVDSQLSNLHVNRALQVALEGDGEYPESAIGLVFEFLVGTVVRQPELIRLLGFVALELGPGTERLARKHLSPIYDAVAAYLEKCNEQGTLCTVDPFTTVLGFASTVVANHCAHRLMAGHESEASNMEEAVAMYTKYWSQALTPMKARICAQPDQQPASALAVQEESISSS
jgi:AcrR family transcriptional regulator